MVDHPSPRRAALFIAIASVLSVVLMAAHPSTGIGREAVISRVVHGGLIALMVLELLGFVELTRRLGWELDRVRAGMIAHALGVLGMIGAALVSGFLVPELASRLEQGAKPLFALCAAMNQTLARAATIALSAAIFSWSCVLLGRDRGARAIALLGFLIAAVVTAGILSGHLQLNVHGMGAVVLAQATWNVCAAIWLVRVYRPLVPDHHSG